MRGGVGSEPRQLLAWVLVGLLLRLSRVVTRWDELTLAYAAYAEPVVTAIQRGELLRAATTWVGLHPPLYAMLQASSELLLPVPLLWLLGSALLSTAAVVLVGRAGGPLAALVLATAPLQVADAAEVNNYPLAACLLALVIVLSRARWPLLALGLVLAAWSHVLAAAGAAGVLCWRLLQPTPRSGERPRLLLATALGVLPVVVGALKRTLQAGTFEQPAGELSAWLSLMVHAVGIEGLLLAGLAILGLRGAALAAWLPVALVLAVALLTGAAAPHQRPYLGLLGPAAAVGVALGVQRMPAGGLRRALTVVVVGLCLLRGGRLAVDEGGRIEQIVADQHRQRALDLALAESAPGDTLWVVVPALEADDDKTATGPLMWRLPPWTPMPIARPVDFEYTDYRYGQPRSFRGRTLHTSTELDPQVFDHVAAAALQRGRIFVVLADHGPATGLVDRVERVLRPYAWTEVDVGDDVGLGVDRLYRLTGRARQ